GLSYAHHRKDGAGETISLVHRDVSPQNIIVSFSGDVKLIDFGIAKARGKMTRTQAGTIKGKFGYMSPEQVKGTDIDHRADINALPESTATRDEVAQFMRSAFPELAKTRSEPENPEKREASVRSTGVRESMNRLDVADPVSQKATRQESLAMAATENKGSDLD